LDRVLTIPNVITIVRLILIPIFGWAFLTGDKDTLALILLMIIGSTDWVDGFVARAIGQVSKLGKALDPVVDRVAIVVILVALTFRGVVPFAIAGVLLLRDLIASIVFPTLEAKGYPRLAVNRTGKLATAFIFSGMAIAAASVLESLEEVARPASVVFLAVGAVLYWIAGYMYYTEIRKLLAARAAA
ncbi:MAG TPA: CDP-alcohol phosphatidyltransferase family protein, partial [Actinomycetota bacterium]|nr:CDP-alcohol phosphatidyltransferase family protein [Actinomycetota bacterium]